MKKLIPFLALTAAVVALVASTSRTVSGQAAAPGQLAVFADMALFSGMNQPRNCFTMNRYRVGEPVGFRVSVIDGATGQPAEDAEVVIHLTYAGKTEQVPARYRGPRIANLWTARWDVPADAPTGVVDVRIVATDKSGRTAEYRPFPNAASHLTIVSE